MERNNKVLIVGIVTLIIGVALGYSLGLGRSNNKVAGINRTSMMGNIDQHFIEQMIPHHEGAIEMAQLALEKAKRPETKTLANGIIVAQQKEIADMKSWYKQWFNKDVPVVGQHMMNGQMMMHGNAHMDSMAGDMEKLKNAKDFDLEFIKQMIPHHEMAVMMAQMLQGSTNRPEMKTLADQIITSQTREIEMMRSWVKAWNTQ